MSLRVAILGASGFGRHHASWYACLGCEVVAFLGSTSESVAATQDTLASCCGFAGRGYTDLDALLATEAPDAASICTPWPLHGPQARACLEAGCSVLCEKPFVWRPNATTAELVAEAFELTALAERQGVVLSVNTQYTAAAEAYARFLPDACDARDTFTGVMTSKLKPAGPRGRDIWLDLAPHSLSILLALMPEGTLVPGSVAGHMGSEATDAAFTLQDGDTSCRCTIRVAKQAQAPFERRFGFGDHVVDCGSAPDAGGTFHGFLRLGNREQTCDDFMKTSIQRFCAAARGDGPPLTTATAAARNQGVLLSLLDAIECKATHN
ncbi:Gfo/Idh/MocA family oxidoreductase [bacterium]|nr:Gfo/Idh/MocA family oxidoreductase [bacterium]